MINTCTNKIIIWKDYMEQTALGKDDNTVKPISFVSIGVFSLCINLRLFCLHMCVKDLFLHHENMSV